MLYSYLLLKIKSNFHLHFVKKCLFYNLKKYDLFFILLEFYKMKKILICIAGLTFEFYNQNLINSIVD